MKFNKNLVEKERQNNANAKKYSKPIQLTQACKNTRGKSIKHVKFFVAILSH